MTDKRKPKMTITYSSFCEKCGEHLEVLEYEIDKPIICLKCLKKLGMSKKMSK